jgi:hypothetical protein
VLLQAMTQDQLDLREAKISLNLHKIKLERNARYRRRHVSGVRALYEIVHVH